MDFKKYMAYLVVSDGVNISYIRQDAYLVSDLASNMNDSHNESMKEQYKQSNAFKN